MRTATGNDALSHVLGLAEQAGARVFPISGTLLGLYRNGGLLKHDSDIDLGVMSDDPALKGLLLSLGRSNDLRLRKISRAGTILRALNPTIPDTLGGALVYKYIYRPSAVTSLQIDLFVHFSAGEEILHGSRRNLWANSRFELMKGDLAGQAFYLPDDCEKYLTENYGDWRTERPVFESSVDCPNVRNCMSFAAIPFLLRKHWQFRTNGDDSRSARICGRISSLIRQAQAH